MKLSTLSDHQFVRELNKELQRHRSFVEGAHFIPYPIDGAVGMLWGFSIEGTVEADAIREIVARCEKRYSLDLSPRALNPATAPVTIAPRERVYE